MLKPTLIILFVLFILGDHSSLHSMLYAEQFKISSLFRKCVGAYNDATLRSIKPDKTEIRSESEPRREKYITIEKKQEQNRLKKEEKIALLKLRLPHMISISVKDGKPVVSQEIIKTLQENRRKKYEQYEPIKFHSSDGGVVPFSPYIAKKSEVIVNMAGGLQHNASPKKFIPVLCSSWALKDMRYILGKKSFTKEDIEEKRYSLAELIERFNFLHSYEFPESIYDIFKEQIIAISTQMNFNDIINSKNLINKLDAKIPEFNFLLQKANAIYLKVVDGEGNFSYIPETIVQMSGTLCSVLKDLEYTIIPQDISIPLIQWRHSIVSELCTIIDQKDATSIEKAIQKYPLETLIDMANCLEYLAFKDKTILKPFHDKISSLCRPIPLRCLPEKLKNLNYDLQDKIIRKPVVEYFKRRMVNDEDKKTVVQGGAEKIIFSPNGKMLTSSRVYYYNRNYIYSWNFCSDGNLHFSKQEIPCVNISINSFAFSPDSKSLVVGFNNDNNNLFKFTVTNNDQKFTLDDKLVLNPWLEGHSAGITATVFHPTGKAMVSADRQGNVLLWTINTDGTANEKPKLLDCTQINEINSAAFSSDGTILVCGGRGTEKNTIFVWNFNDNGTIQNTVPKGYCLPKATNVKSVSFISGSKKFIATSYSYFQIVPSRTFLGDLSADNIEFREIEDDHCRDYIASFVSPDGKKLVKITDNCAFLFTIHGNDILYDYPLVGGQDINCVAFSSDSTKIAIGGKENSIILKLLTDEDKKICSNISMDQAFLLNKMIFSSGTENCNAADYETIPPRLISLLREAQFISDQEYPITEEEKRLLKKREIRKSIHSELEKQNQRDKKIYMEDLLLLHKLKKKVKDENLFMEVINEVRLSDQFNQELPEAKKVLRERLLDLGESLFKNLEIVKRNYMNRVGIDIIENIFDEVVQEIRLSSSNLSIKGMNTSAQLEKEKEHQRRYFSGPHLQTVEERTQAITMLKNIYTGIQKEAFEQVVKEMGLSDLLH